MTYTYDPEIAEALRAFADLAPPKFPRGDWKGLRDAVNGLMDLARDITPIAAGVAIRSFEMATEDGARIGLSWFDMPGRVRGGSAVLYIHGGGMICGSVDRYASKIAEYVYAAGVPMLAVDYRLAPEFPHPVPVEDCYAALGWLLSHSDELGIDASRVAVMGDSAGGGLAAGTALLARDRSIGLAQQILIYQMLDDRNIFPDPYLAPLASWSYDDNFNGWRALLGDRMGQDSVVSFAAPARASNLAGAAPLYLEVGDLDIFRNECIAYARTAALGNVALELHVHGGAPHAFDTIAPQAAVSQRAFRDRVRVLAAL